MVVKALRPTQRGEVGTYAIQFTTKTDSLIGAAPALPGSAVTVLTDADRLLRIPVDQVNLWGKEGAGDRAVKLPKKETILEICSLEVREGEES
jgi:DNA gyrase subunit A